MREMPADDATVRGRNWSNRPNSVDANRVGIGSLPHWPFPFFFPNHFLFYCLFVLVKNPHPNTRCYPRASVLERLWTSILEKSTSPGLGVYEVSYSTNSRFLVSPSSRGTYRRSYGPAYLPGVSFSPLFDNIFLSLVIDINMYMRDNLL